MAESWPKVGIVIVNYRSGEELLRALRSVLASSYPEKEVCVVDNASGDGTIERIREEFPEVFCIENPENRGFSYAANQGLRWFFDRGFEYFWVFNPDATSGSETLRRLVFEAEKRPKVGLFSPLILNESGKEWFCAGKIDWWRMRAIHRPITERERARNLVGYQDFLTGCALFIRRSVLERVGFFDEQFFLYYEDVDLCFRAKQNGFYLLTVLQAPVWHREASRFRPEKSYHLVLSGLLFFGKWASFWWQQYYFLYGTMRRLKNWLDRRDNRNKEAMEVGRAYATWFGEKKNNSHHR